GLRAEDPDERQEIWNEIFDLLSREVPLYPLFHRKTPTAWHEEMLVDFKPISLTGLSFENVATTRWPRTGPGSKCRGRPPSPPPARGELTRVQPGPSDRTAPGRAADH